MRNYRIRKISTIDVKLSYNRFYIQKRYMFFFWGDMVEGCSIEGYTRKLFDDIDSAKAYIMIDRRKTPKDEIVYSE